MREIPFAFIQFTVHDALKRTWASLQGHETTLPQAASCGSVAGAVAGAVTVPLDVMRTRIMLQHSDRCGGTLQTLHALALEEGALALFKGIMPRMTMTGVGGFIFLGAYESFSRYLSARFC